MNPSMAAPLCLLALMAFAAALKLPQLLDVLFQVANDPNVFSQAVDVGTRQ